MRDIWSDRAGVTVLSARECVIKGHLMSYRIGIVWYLSSACCRGCSRQLVRKPTGETLISNKGHELGLAIVVSKVEDNVDDAHKNQLDARH